MLFKEIIHVCTEKYQSEITKLHFKMLRNLYIVPCIVKDILWRRMVGIELIASLDETKNI
jgi:thymidylate synthase ThyX